TRHDRHAQANRSERRPAHVPTAEAPVDPGRTPHRPRQPDPTVGGVVPPATVVERRPAPGPIALERPAVVRVDPMAAGRVRREVRAGDRAGRPPYPAGACDIDPP